MEILLDVTKMHFWIVFASMVIFTSCLGIRKEVLKSSKMISNQEESLNKIESTVDAIEKEWLTMGKSSQDTLKRDFDCFYEQELAMAKEEVE